MSCRFNIDFFEFSFLVEACIPPRPIARTSFWHDVIDRYYYILTKDERERLYEWIGRNPNYKDSIEKQDEDCLLFEARYNPDNQYRITTLINGEEEYHECFKYRDEYHTKRNVMLNEEYITETEKI